MSMTSDQPRSGNVQAVIFALSILEYVAQCQTSVGVTELARAFGTTKSRIHRHLQTLVTAGYLTRSDESERYAISARLMAFGQAVSESFEIASAARHIARELRDSLGHAVAISQPERTGNRVLLMMPSRSNLDVSVKPGSILSFPASAQGKVTLAFGDPMLLPQVISAGIEKVTPYTITETARLVSEIEIIRRKGWAVAPNEAMVGLNALAAPIFDALGHYVGAVAITDSIQFITETPSPEQISGVLDAAEKVSENLGFRPRTKAGPAAQGTGEENL